MFKKKYITAIPRGLFVGATAPESRSATQVQPFYLIAERSYYWHAANAASSKS